MGQTLQHLRSKEDIFPHQHRKQPLDAPGHSTHNRQNYFLLRLHVTGAGDRYLRAALRFINDEATSRRRDFDSSDWRQIDVAHSNTSLPQ